LIATVRTARKLEGAIRVPGDKSISHRALILGALASGRSRLRGLSTGADVESTAACLGALGVDVDETGVAGGGLSGLRRAAGPLDCGNSGTTMRLLAGLLAGQAFESELAGDESLSRRPMGRVIEPLVLMGAKAAWPPLRVGGATPLLGIDYPMPVASAQVKSAILLAGLYAGGLTTVTEPVRTRDHTERMLKAMGAGVEVDGLTVRIAPGAALEPLDVEIPGDVSAAAFWIVAGGLVQGSHVRMQATGINATRTAFIGVLQRCGFQVPLSSRAAIAGEEVADLGVQTASARRAMRVEGTMAAEMIDELPVLAVAATQMPGQSVISGAAELRVKESDRIAAMEEGLQAMGADIIATDDGWVINGPRELEGARVSSHRDHRVAMALAVAGLLAQGRTEIEDAECVEISYPQFFDHLEYLC
jgi:3-phosphoshikimate 1-carboxyvinyltransferase